MNSVAEFLESRKVEGNYRTLLQERAGIDFSSNDYLGLSRSPSIRQALIVALEEGCALGATGSRLLSGNTVWHERVEAFLAGTFKVESALLFGSGFAANLGVMAALGGDQSEFFSDQLNHASLVDGMRLAKSKRTIFRHGDLNNLEELLSKSSCSIKVIVTESVFSMDGDLAPLDSLFQLAKRFDAWLVVDEAHATGVFGQRALGRTEDFNAEDVKIVSVHTGGKALGGQGAFVLSNCQFRDLLINRARTFIFSTALSPLSALQIEFAVKEVLKAPLSGSQLLRSANEVKYALGNFVETLSSQSQIIPAVLGSNERVVRVSGALRERGMDVRAIRAPTVPRGSERLRITLKSFHTQSEVASLIENLREVLAL